MQSVNKQLFFTSSTSSGRATRAQAKSCKKEIVYASSPAGISYIESKPLGKYRRSRRCSTNKQVSDVSRRQVASQVLAPWVQVSHEIHYWRKAHACLFHRAKEELFCLFWGQVTRGKSPSEEATKCITSLQTLDSEGEETHTPRLTDTKNPAKMTTYLSNRREQTPSLLSTRATVGWFTRRSKRLNTTGHIPNGKCLEKDTNTPHRTGSEGINNA